MKATAKFNSETVGEVSFGSEFCDGLWHTVAVELRDGILFVSADGLSRNTDLTEPGYNPSLLSASMLFVGGLPGTLTLFLMGKATYQSHSIDHNITDQPAGGPCQVCI